jgi:hypothetical protein
MVGQYGKGPLEWVHTWGPQVLENLLITFICYKHYYYNIITTIILQSFYIKILLLQYYYNDLLQYVWTWH